MCMRILSVSCLKEIIVEIEEKTVGFFVWLSLKDIFIHMHWLRVWRLKLSFKLSCSTISLREKYLQLFFQSLNLILKAHFPLPFTLMVKCNVPGRWWSMFMSSVDKTCSITQHHWLRTLYLLKILMFFYFDNLLEQIFFHSLLTSKLISSLVKYKAIKTKSAEKYF